MALFLKVQNDEIVSGNLKKVWILRKEESKSKW